MDGTVVSRLIMQSSVAVSPPGVQRETNRVTLTETKNVTTSDSVEISIALNISGFMHR